MVASKDTNLPAARKAGVTSLAGKFARNVPRTKIPATIDPMLRQQLISEAAYFRAERRGFVAGSAIEDWLAAELEIDERLSRSTVEDQTTAQPGVLNEHGPAPDSRSAKPAAAGEVRPVEGRRRSPARRH